jgi:hypothetical protein
MVAWVVAEVAIAAAYVLLMTMSEPRADAAATAEEQALEAVAHVVVSWPKHFGIGQYQPCSGGSSSVRLFVRSNSAKLHTAAPHHV